jgi:hypothetical protein
VLVRQFGETDCYDPVFDRREMRWARRQAHPPRAALIRFALSSRSGKPNAGRKTGAVQAPLLRS